MPASSPRLRATPYPEIEHGRGEDAMALYGGKSYKENVKGLC